MNRPNSTLTLTIVICVLIFLDWVTDGRIDGFGTHIPYMVLPLQVKSYALYGWIRVKKKDGRTVNIDLKDVDQIDMKATLRQLKRNEHHHKKEAH